MGFIHKQNQKGKIMELLNEELLKELISVSQAPCISLYMPTHRSFPENLQDPIRFKNIIKQLEDNLLQQYTANEVQKLLDPLIVFDNKTETWNHTLDGLAIFRNSDDFKAIGLQVPVEELLVISDKFHTKPIRHYLQTVDRYHILGLSLNDIKLFEGNRDSLIEVELPVGMPKTLADALGTEVTEKHSTVASYGGVGGDSSAMHHGQGAKNDEEEKDTEKFFRIIAGAIYENFSKPSSLPLILAALPEHHNLFHKVSKNPFLISKGIAVNYNSVKIDILNKLAWDIIESNYLQKLGDMVDKFEQARANGLGLDNIDQVIEAAKAGRVENILIEADRLIPKNLENKTSQKANITNYSLPQLDDLLDDISELVTKMGGKVTIIPKEKMPTNTGLAATLRY